MGNKMGPEHSWGQSGRVRTLVPDHILGSSRGHPCQGSVGFVGSALWGQGAQHSPTLPPLQFTSSSAEFSCCLQLSCLLHLSSFQGPGGKFSYQSPAASSQVWSRHAALGRVWGGVQGQVGELRGRGVVSVMLGEDLKAPLFGWLFYEVAHPQTCPLCTYDPFSLGLFSSSYFQLA